MKEKIFQFLGKIFVGVYSFFAYDFDIQKNEDFSEGPKIYVANHPCTVDPFISLLLTKGKTSILIKEFLFKIPIFGLILKHSGHISVSSENGKIAFEKAKVRLLKGENIFIFIEGDLSPSEFNFRKPKTGAVRLAMLTGSKIVPIGVNLIYDKINIFKSKNEGESGYWYFHGPYAITIGKPVKVKGNVKNFSNVCRVSDAIMQKVVNLSQESRLRLERKERVFVFKRRNIFFQAVNQFLLIIFFFHVKFM